MAEEGWSSEAYVSDKFRWYYASNAVRVDAPPQILQREFGFLSFGGRNMFRHIGFDDPQELRNYLMDYSPAHSYFSAAYYEDPRTDMDRKGWLGADLVFDIDADHFDLPCQKGHDRWTCRGCGKEGVGHAPDLCPGCGKASFVEENWLCEKCLDAAKYEAQKLIDILVQDFGFSQSRELSVNFSGNRGYHVHVRSPAVKELNQMTRREVVDYIMGIGIEAEFQGFTSRPVGGGSTISEDGWRMRSAKALYDFLSEATPETLRALKIRRPQLDDLLAERDNVLDTLMKRHPSAVFKHVKKNLLDKLLAAAVNQQAAAIDTVVTTDLRRLIRLPNTLHGKTGWLTQNVPIDDLADYDPLTSAVAFRTGTEKIQIRRTPEIKLAGETYGPFEDETVELPLAVAMFILCRMAGKVVR